MACGAINPGNPYLWLSLAGIFLGGGARFLLAPRRRRKPSVGVIFISISIFALLISVYLSGFSFLDLDFRLYWLGAAFLLGYLGFFFWKAVGIPLLFILILLVASVWSAFYGWNCAEPGGDICSFNIISRGEDFLRVQYETSGGITGLDKIEGINMYPELEIITVPEFLFILNENGMYRFTGFMGEEYEHNAPRHGIVINTLLRLPGVGLADTFEALHPAPSIEYSLFLNKKGEPEIIKRIE